MPRVIGIFLCEDKGLPMREVRTIQALAGIGLQGDRYALGKGAYSQSKFAKIRHVSLISLEAIREANRISPVSFTLEETRRNIIVSGLDLNPLVGKKLMVGGALLLITELCDPCDRPSKLCGKEGFEPAFTSRGGLRAEVLEPGRIYLNAQISVRG